MSVRFVAEVSSNHNGDLDRCLRFVDTAARIGCWAVKFQLFRLDHLFAPEALAHNPDLEARRAWELPPEFLPRLAQRSRERGVLLGCTPFDLQAVEELRVHVDFYKVASYELLWDDLLAACAATVKPVVLSTGMATLDEIAHAVEVLRGAGCRDLTLLHCTSAYPARPADCNLAALATLRERFGVAAGWSDHSVSPGVIHRAVHRWGAAMVEFHLDLDGTGVESGFGHCWPPEAIARVIGEVNQGLAADGHGRKEPAGAEQEERMWRADPSDGLRPMKPLRYALKPRSDASAPESERRTR